MPVCRNCGVETPEDEYRLYSGQCRVCYESKLNEDESITRNQYTIFETTPVPSIDQKWKKKLEKEVSKVEKKKWGKKSSEMKFVLMCCLITGIIGAVIGGMIFGGLGILIGFLIGFLGPLAMGGGGC